MSAKRPLDEDLARAIALALEAEKSFGLDDLPRGRVGEAAASPVGAQDSPVVPGSPRESRRDIEAIAAEIAVCERCSLCRTRQKTVPGRGAAPARLMFVGEAPGADEDASGEPFVGRAGQLLTKMIEAMGLDREQVFIANVLKCRPPGNRNPEADEIAACLPFLRAQIAEVAPEIICSLGAVATRALTGREEGIGRLRNQPLDFEGRRVVATFHPSYLLREPAKKREAWDDLKQVMAILGLDNQGRGKSQT